MATQNSEKKKISLMEYLDKDINLTEIQKFAWSRSFVLEQDRSFDDWKKFFEDK